MKKILFGIAFAAGTMIFCLEGGVQAGSYTSSYSSLKTLPYAEANKKNIYNYKYYFRRNWSLPRTTWDNRILKTPTYRFSPKFQQTDYEKWRGMSGDSHDLTATEWNQSNNGGTTREEARQRALEESAKRKGGMMCGEKFMTNIEAMRWDCTCEAVEDSETQKDWVCDNKREEFCQFKNSGMGEYLKNLEVRNRCCVCNDGWKCEYTTVSGSTEPHKCSWEVRGTSLGTNDGNMKRTH